MPSPLEVRTNEYWKFNLACRGKLPGILAPTVERAISLCNTNLANLDPNRPLAKRLRILQHETIVGGKKVKAKNGATVTTLRKVVVQ